MQELVPKLRFPEFEEEWKEKKIAEIAPLQRGFDLPVDNIVNGEFPVVFSNGILKYHNSCKAKAPGVVTGRSGTIGKVTFVENDYWPHNTALWVTNFNGNHPKFVFYFYVKFDLVRFATGSGVPTLNRNDVHVQNVHFPTLPEQTKIAEFLTAIDKRIELLTAKKEKLTLYKKGVMQKIFSQEIRFKQDDGGEFPEWEERKIRQLMKIENGRDYKHLSKGNIPVFGTGGLMTYVDKCLYDGETVFIGRKGTIDKPYYFNGKFWTVDTLFYTSSFKDCTPRFIFYCFYLINWKRFNEASGVPSLSKSTLNEIDLNIPSIEEQTKITNFLVKIDAQIQKVEQQITLNQTYKRGLLQQMFV